MEAATETKFGTKVAYGIRMMPKLIIFSKYSCRSSVKQHAHMQHCVIVL